MSSVGSWCTEWEGGGRVWEHGEQSKDFIAGAKVWGRGGYGSSLSCCQPDLDTV